MLQRIRFITIVWGTLFLSCVATIKAQPVTNDAMLNGSEVSLSDLPQEIFRRSPNGLDDKQYSQWLANQPALILNGGTLRIGRPGMGVSLTMRVSRLELRNAARIITNGADLEISAVSFVSENGEIIAFENKVTSPVQERLGLPGVSGFPGGKLTLSGRLERGSHLVIKLDGQDGGQGGQGRAGQRGEPGVPGNRAADHLFDCAHGGGTGGRGGKGQTGERGARGGAAGDGGILVLNGPIASQADHQIDFSGNPGAPGWGGLGGAGGLGGLGGEGGGGSTFCGGGPKGPDGPPGDFGPSGEVGEKGSPGRLMLNPQG